MRIGRSWAVEGGLGKGSVAVVGASWVEARAWARVPVGGHTLGRGCAWWGGVRENNG